MSARDRTTTRDQIDALRELHQDTSTAGRVRQLLDQACEHDTAARAARREAGRALAELRAQHPREWLRLAGIDRRLGEMLVNMATGRD